MVFLSKLLKSFLIFLSNESTAASTAMIEKIPIVGTPFMSVKYNGSYFLMLGIYRLNETTLNSHEEVLSYVEEQTWNLIPKVILITINDTLEVAKQSSKINQNQNNGN